MAGDPRDIEFECPCQAEWVPDDSGMSGELTLNFGVRSHRATQSGEIRLQPEAVWDPSEWPTLGEIPKKTLLAQRTQTMVFSKPKAGVPITVPLYERVSKPPAAEARAQSTRFVAPQRNPYPLAGTGSCISWADPVPGHPHGYRSRRRGRRERTLCWYVARECG